MTNARRKALRTLLVLSAVVGLRTEVAAAGDIQPAPITARLQEGPAPSSRDVVRLGQRTVHATPALFQINRQASVLAYTLDPRRLPVISATTWRAVALGTPGLHGLATALWTMRQKLPGAPLRGDLEGAARQIAIWATGAGLHITPTSVPDGALRRRSRLLVGAAPSDLKDVGQQPTTLTMSPSTSGAGDHGTKVAVHVGDEREDTFDHPQRIDLRVDGRWTVVTTHARFTIDVRRPGRTLIARRSGSAPDNNTALVDLEHVADTDQIELFWNLTLNPGVALLPDGDAPAIITANPSKVGLRRAIAPPPRAAATSGQPWLLVYGAGWLSAIAAIGGLWLTGRRKPALRAAWNTYDTNSGLLEVADITAIAGRRPIEVQELGIVVTWGLPWRRRHHHVAGPTQRTLPALLQDGASVETSFELSGLIDDLFMAIGERARLIAIARPYVSGSGKEFRGRTMADHPWERLRQLVRSYGVGRRPDDSTS